MLPCGLAAGIVGELPQAGSCEPSARRRVSSAAPPISDTSRAKVSEKFNALFHSRMWVTRHVLRIDLRFHAEQPPTLPVKTRTFSLSTPSTLAMPPLRLKTPLHPTRNGPPLSPIGL